MLERAIAIAAEAHSGQCDKAGRPYILHCLRVMLRMSKPEEMIVAVLHDVIEDTSWTSVRLIEVGLSDTIVNAIQALSRQDGETYRDFIARAGLNSIAKSVKLADLADNMDLSRIADPGELDRERYMRYEEAREFLD